MFIISFYVLRFNREDSWELARVGHWDLFYASPYFVPVKLVPGFAYTLLRSKKPLPIKSSEPTVSLSQTVIRS